MDYIPYETMGIWFTYVEWTKMIMTACDHPSASKATLVDMQN